MILFPAIDIRQGRVVRLRQGDYAQEKQYGFDPMAMAQKWVAAGARWLHVVDLDAALTGTPTNLALIEKIVKQNKVNVQVGGGIRDLKTVETYVNLGIKSVVLGTAAVKNPAFLKEAVENFPDRISLGLDTKKGYLATDGWTKTSSIKIEAFLKNIPEVGLAWLIHTEIERDGMLTGLQTEGIKHFLEIAPTAVVVSGGVSSLDDIKILAELVEEYSNLDGVIVGKALYEGKIDLEEALQYAR